jgi:DNA-binding LytR/AlgR family response regulator
MKIAICEDNKNERESLRGLLDAELAKRRIDGEVVVFENGEAMLAAMRDEVFTINFLDIYMGKTTGVDVAKMIRARDEKAAIVFITSSREHMAEGFDVGAVHYLTKPFTGDAVRDALDRCFRITGTAERFIEVTAGGEKRKLFLSKILWVESQNKSCVIRSREESLRVYTRLDELMTQLDDPRFLRCHRSFIVNLDFVANINGSDFVMKEGSLIPVRREDRVRIKEYFQNYSFEKLRGGLYHV